jgi:hypothetical protein
MVLFESVQGPMRRGALCHLHCMSVKNSSVVVSQASWQPFSRHCVNVGIADRGPFPKASGYLLEDGGTCLFRFSSTAPYPRDIIVSGSHIGEGKVQVRCSWSEVRVSGAKVRGRLKIKQATAEERSMALTLIYIYVFKGDKTNP